MYLYRYKKIICAILFWKRIWNMIQCRHPFPSREINVNINFCSSHTWKVNAGRIRLFLLPTTRFLVCFYKRHSTTPLAAVRSRRGTRPLWLQQSVRCPKEFKNLKMQREDECQVKLVRSCRCKKNLASRCWAMSSHEIFPPYAYTTAVCKTNVGKGLTPLERIRCVAQLIFNNRCSFFIMLKIPVKSGAVKSHR